MALLKYFKKTLPTAKDTEIGELATKEANAAVSKVLQEAAQPQSTVSHKRKHTVFSPEQRAVIGQYAAEHSNIATVKKFKADFEHGLGESTVRSFKKKYLEELKKSKERISDGEVPRVTEITTKPRGSPLLLGKFDGDVQIVTAKNQNLLLKYGGHIELNRPWAVSLLQRMGFVRRLGSTQTKAILSCEQISKSKHTYLTQVIGMVKAHDIPPNLVINWDQAGVKLVPLQNWTMEEKGSSRIEVAGINDKRQITLTLAGSLSGELLPLQLLYQGKTERSHPKYTFPPEFDVWHTPNHWANEETTLRFITHIIILYLQGVRNRNNTPDQGALVIFDVFKGHMGEAVQTLLKENKIFRVVVPSNCTDLFQPLDLSVNKPFKDKLRRGFSEWYAQEVAKQLTDNVQPDAVHIDMRMSIVKKLSCRWIMSAYNHIHSSPEIVRNGFKKQVLPMQ